MRHNIIGEKETKEMVPSLPNQKGYNTKHRADMWRDYILHAIPNYLQQYIAATDSTSTPLLHV